MSVALTRPFPLEPIAIVQLFTRIHILKTTPSLYAATLHVIRDSDGSIMVGASCNKGLLYTTLAEVAAEHEEIYTGDRHFRLEIGDELRAHFQTFLEISNPPPRPDEFIAEVSIIVAYARFNPAYPPADPTLPIPSEFL